MSKRVKKARFLSFFKLLVWSLANIDETVTLNFILKGLKSIAGISIIIGNCLLVPFNFSTVRGMGVFHKGPAIICLLWTAVTFIVLLDNDP